MTQHRLDLEERLRTAARNLPVPPSPDLLAAGAPPAPASLWSVMPARALTAAAVALAIVVVAAVPQVRADVVRVLRVGAVRLIDPTGPPLATDSRVTPPARAPGFATPAGAGDVPRQASTLPPAPVTPDAAATTDQTPPDAPWPPAMGITSLDALAGETTLDAARRAMPFPIPLPAHPVGLGPPDRVFVQHPGAPAVLLAWTAANAPDRAAMVLHVLDSQAFVSKGGPTVVATADLDGTSALWLRGPHFLMTGDDQGRVLGRLVEGHVLVWQRQEVTYRLETTFDIAEALMVARSLEQP